MRGSHLTPEQMKPTAWWTYFAWPITIIVILIVCLPIGMWQGVTRWRAEATQQAATVEARLNASADRQATVTAASAAALAGLRELAETQLVHDQLYLIINQEDIPNTDSGDCEEGVIYDGFLTVQVIEFHKQHENFAFVAVLDTEGCVHAADPQLPYELTADPAEARWFEPALSGEEYAATGTDRVFSNAQGIITALPIYDDDTVIGVVMGVWTYE